MVMHNSAAVQRWQGVVEPGLSATIRVIYRPSLMPVEGPVARNVKFATNDPSRPVVELGVPATVQCEDRKSGVSGQSVSVRVELGGRRIVKKTNKTQTDRNQTKITKTQ